MSWQSKATPQHPGQTESRCFWIAKIFLVVGGLAMGALVSEVMIRVFNLPPKPLPALPISTYQLSASPLIEYEYRPNYAAKEDPFDSSHAGFSTNSQGFRDREFIFAKSPDVLRVLCLGDSTTAGNFISRSEDVYPRRLEALLNSRSTERRFQVYNMGVGGYQTVQEAETLRLKGLHYAPDCVTVLVCLNDFLSTADGGVRRALEERNQNLIARSSGVRLSRFLLRTSRLAFFIYYKFQDPANFAVVPPGMHRVRMEPSNPMETGMAALAELQEQYGFRAIVFILPGLDGRFDDYRYRHLHRKVATVVGRYPRIELFDLLDDFSLVEADGSKLGVDGVHLNHYGHDLLSRIIAQKVLQGQ